MLTLREYLSKDFYLPPREHFFSLAGRGWNKTRAETASHVFSRPHCRIDPFAMHKPALPTGRTPKPSVEALLKLIPRRSCVIYYGNPEKCMFRSAFPLLRLFAAIEKLGKFRYVIVVGKSQFTFGKQLLAKIPSNVMRVYTMNCACKHAKLRCYPVGRDYRCLVTYAPAVYGGVGALTEKQKKIYVQFSDFSNRAGRSLCKNGLKGKAFAVFGAPCKNMLEYHKTIAKYRYVACPPGRGYDTMRFWEALFLKCIPVVSDTPVNKSFLDLPFIVVKDWKKITLERLEKSFRYMLRKKYNFRKMSLVYWQKLINADSRRWLGGVPAYGVNPRILPTEPKLLLINAQGECQDPSFCAQTLSPPSAQELSFKHASAQGESPLSTFSAQDLSFKHASAPKAESLCSEPQQTGESHSIPSHETDKVCDRDSGSGNASQ